MYFQYKIIKLKIFQNVIRTFLFQFSFGSFCTLSMFLYLLALFEPCQLFPYAMSSGFRQAILSQRLFCPGFPGLSYYLFCLIFLCLFFSLFPYAMSSGFGQAILSQRLFCPGFPGLSYYLSCLIFLCLFLVTFSICDVVKFRTGHTKSETVLPRFPRTVLLPVLSHLSFLFS